MTADESQCSAASGFWWPEQDNPSIIPWVVGTKVTHTLIHGQEDPAFSRGVLEYERVRKTEAKALGMRASVLDDAVQRLREDYQIELAELYLQQGRLVDAEAL